VTIDSVPGSVIENIGNLFLTQLGISETPHTLRVNPGLVSFNRSSIVWNGFGATPGNIQLNGGTFEVQDNFGGIGEVTNFSASTISGFGIIDADIDNDGSILPSGTGLTIRGKFMQPAGSVTGSVITLTNSAAFEGKGTVNAGFTVPSGVNVTLTGDAQFGTFGAAAAAGINMDGNVFLGGFNALFRDAGLIDFTGTTNLQGGTLGVVNGGRVTAAAKLNGPGTLGGDWQMNGLLNTNGALNVTAGSLTLGAVADTQLIMRNTAAGGFGSINVAAPGIASLNGNLEVVFRDSFDYVDGDSFVIVNAPGGRAGGFTGVAYTNPRNGAIFNLVYAANAVRLRVVRGGCDSIDFNNNGVFPEDQDVIDFFDVLAGGSPATCDPVQGCNGIDFNNNGVFPEDQDVIDFFNVLAGGAC
ncbi:MAG TPA: hypothetical protein VK157_15020, partial [Phycisphaerales bacterium]|nr:hypothetical protein [Phycisphaerales bacterium]